MLIDLFKCSDSQSTGQVARLRSKDRSRGVGEKPCLSPRGNLSVLVDGDGIW